MVGSLLILGFTLSLDNFRTAVALGAVQPTWRRSVQVA
jgi:putative Mn2+ efflux pump MntP